MKKILLKIVDDIAKKHNSSLVEVLSIFLANIVSGNRDFKNVASKIFDLKKLNKNEIQALKIFFDLLNEEDCVFDSKESIENISEFFDENSAKHLALFFTPFLSKEAILNKDPQKIRKDLEKYPKEIKEAILKSLEMLSVSEKIDNEEILKEVLKIICVLSNVFRIIGEENEY